MHKSKGFLLSLSGIAVLIWGSLPILFAPTVGDDFESLFRTYVETRGSLLTALDIGWRSGFSTGHSNPVGQAIGAAYHVIVFEASMWLHVSPNYIYGVVTILCLIAIAVFGTRIIQLSTTPKPKVHRGSSSAYVHFALMASILGITVQLHPWSNDPTTTYTMAGLASTVLGFTVILLALKATAAQSETRYWRTLIYLAFVSSIAVLFYEMLVAAVAAATAIYVLSLTKTRNVEHKMQVIPVVGLLFAGTILPGIVFLVARQISSSVGNSGYSGTIIDLTWGSLKTWVFGIVSALPGGAWPYTLKQLHQFSISTATLVLIVAGVILFLATFIVVRANSAFVHNRSLDRMPVLVIALAIYWFGSTAIQAITIKYSAEISAPGLVYTFYAAGWPICVLLITLLVERQVMNRSIITITTVISLASVFFALQLSCNWTIVSYMRNVQFSRNITLEKHFFTSNSTDENRCAALREWTSFPWPDYYMNSVIVNAQSSFELVEKRNFCVTPITIKMK